MMEEKSFVIGGKPVKVTAKSSTFTHIPLPGCAEASGALYRYHLPRAHEMKQMKEEGIRLVLVACRDADGPFAAGLSANYAQHQIDCEVMNIMNYTVPTDYSMTKAIARAKEYLARGENVLCHCQFGQGRTGTVLACLVSDLLDLDGAQAIEYLRLFFPAVETERQERFVIDWCAQQKAKRDEKNDAAKDAVPAKAD